MFYITRLYFQKKPKTLQNPNKTNNKKTKQTNRNTITQIQINLKQNKLIQN